MKTSALTATADLVGTLRYMAPERFQRGSDERADIYALGLTLYELLVLRPAFDSRDRQPSRGQGGGAVSPCCFAQTSRGVSLIIRRSWRERSTAAPLRATSGLHRRFRKGIPSSGDRSVTPVLWQCNSVRGLPRSGDRSVTGVLSQCSQARSVWVNNGVRSLMGVQAMSRDVRGAPRSGARSFTFDFQHSSSFRGMPSSGDRSATSVQWTARRVSGSPRSGRRSARRLGSLNDTPGYSSLRSPRRARSGDRSVTSAEEKAHCVTTPSTTLNRTCPSKPGLSARNCCRTASICWSADRALKAAATATAKPARTSSPTAAHNQRRVRRLGAAGRGPDSRATP